MFRMTTTLLRMTSAIDSSRRLSQAIKESASAAGVSQRDLANQTGIPLVTLNRKLNHDSPFNAVEMGAISEALGISLLELVLRSERLAATAA